MNHARVIAETEPFTWLALETTGGYLVWGENKSMKELLKTIFIIVDCVLTIPPSLRNF